MLVLILRAVRKVAGWFGLMKPGVGNHCCWRCELYQPEIGACTILVNRGKKDPNTGLLMFEIRKVEASEFCVWRGLPDHMIECVDFSREKGDPELEDDDDVDIPGPGAT